MRNRKKRWLSLAIAPALLALLSVAQPAYADGYAGNCTDVPASIDGDAYISDENACVIGHDVTATGSIFVSSLGSSVSAQGLTSTGGHIAVNGTSVTTEEISSSSHIQVDATDGTISLGDLNANSGDQNGNIMLTATGNIGTGNITATGSSGYGSVQIRANTDGGNTVFNVGGGGANGTGTIDTRTTTGGGTAIDYIHGGLYIINGNSASTGGITLNAMTDLLVESSGSRSGIIILDAKGGTLTLPAGTLRSNGPSGFNAGYIILMAHRVDAADGAIISVMQGPTENPAYYGIQIATETVGVAGSDGLQIITDGNSFSGVATSLIVPEGGISVSSTDQLSELLWTFSHNDLYAKTGKVEIAGSGKFKATANGNNQLLAISGYPLKFTADNVELEAKGATNHNIKLGFYGSLAGGEGLVFTGSGDFKADASGIDGNGGKIEINGADSEISSASFVVKANGPSAGNGDGGTVKWFSTALSVDEGSTVSFTADAALVGTGNAKSNAIDFRSEGGDLAIGTAEGQAAFSAKGGGSAGNGGTIKFVLAGAATVYGAGPTAGAFDVSVPGDTGNGGKIDILTVYGITFDGDASYLKADSGAIFGDGGIIKIETSSEPFIIGTDEAGAVDLSAKSNGDGKGGTVDIYSPVGLRANGAHINVSAGGSQQGGTISLNAGSIEDLYISGTLRADGGDDGGDGGSITLYGGKVTLPGDANTEVKANGKGAGNGGQIVITTNFEGSIRIGNGTAEVRLEARSEDGGNGGTINLLSDGEVYLYGAAIDVNVMAGDGDGGAIIAESQNDSVVVVGDLTAAGFGAGNGGTIELTAALNIDLTDAYIRAPGGLTGNGGQITITTEDDLTIDDLSEISALAGVDGDGKGGSVTLQSNVTTMQGTIKVNGFGNGQGGEISIKADTEITTDGQLEANGGCELGDGGYIALEGPTVSTYGISQSSGSDVCFAFAKRTRFPQSLVDPGTGKGGTYRIGTPEALAIWQFDEQSDFSQNSKSGNGGNIEIYNSNEADVSILKSGALSAKGANEGEGGRVFVKKIAKKATGNPLDPYRPLDVIDLMDPTGGPELEEGRFDGSIEINDVKCQQHLIDKSAWPRTFWNCTPNPQTNESLDVIPYAVAASLAMEANRASLDGANGQTFVFRKGGLYTSGGYNAFFGDGLNDNAGARTFKGYSNNTLYVAPWQEGSIGASSIIDFNEDQLTEVALHELGHAVDIVLGFPSKSAPYGVYTSRDFKDFNEIWDPTLPTPAYITRDPCSPTTLHSGTSSETPPFEDVIDLATGDPVCNAGVLSGRFAGASNNTAVLSLLEISIWLTREEIHAQTFSYNGFGNLGARPMTDKIFDNGYFQCIKDWAHEEGIGGAIPPTTPLSPRHDACNVAP